MSTVTKPNWRIDHNRTEITSKHTKILNNKTSNENISKIIISTIKSKNPIKNKPCNRLSVGQSAENTSDGNISWSHHSTKTDKQF